MRRNSLRRSEDGPSSLAASMCSSLRNGPPSRLCLPQKHRIGDAGSSVPVHRFGEDPTHTPTPPSEGTPPPHHPRCALLTGPEGSVLLAPLPCVGRERKAGSGQGQGRARCHDRGRQGPRRAGRASTGDGGGETARTRTAGRRQRTARGPSPQHSDSGGMAALWEPCARVSQRRATTPYPSNRARSSVGLSLDVVLNAVKRTARRRSRTRR